MRALLFLTLAVLVVPQAIAAGGVSGWRYPGDTFESEGVVYSVEGDDHEQVLLGVGSKLYLLRLGECQSEGAAEYCYEDTGYPGESRVKYIDGEKHYGYYLAITQDAASLSVSRELSDDDLAPGEEAEITVEIENKGKRMVTGLRFSEPIPQGLAIAAGPREGATIEYRRTSLRPGEEARFIYRVRADVPGEFTLSPSLTYEYGDVPGNVSVRAETIEVRSPLKISRTVTGTVDIDGNGTYALTIENTDPREDIEVEVLVALPESFEETSLEGFSRGGGALRAQVRVRSEEERTVRFGFEPTKAGTFELPVSLSARANGAPLAHEIVDKITVREDALEASLLLSPQRSSYPARSTLAVSGVLENTNPSLTFSRIEGTLSGPLFDNIAFSYDRLGPGKTLTRPTATLRLPAANGSQEYPVRFSGTYRSSKGRELAFSIEDTIVVDAPALPVDVTHELEPAQAVPGENITVRASIVNQAGSYLTLEAQESYPQGLTQLSGLTRATASLRDGDRAQLYVYQLLVPEDIEGAGFNITTRVTLKSEAAPLEFIAYVPIAEREEAAPVQEAQVEPEIAGEQAAEQEKKELGFFASIWDFVKGLFD